jgi:hypothetical protein
VDYCTLEEARTELVKQGASAIDDNAIAERIPRACARVDRVCRHMLPGGRRAFDDEAITGEIRRAPQVVSADDGALVVTTSKGYCQFVTSAEYSTDLKTWTALPLDQLDIAGYVLTFLNVNAPRTGRLFTRLSYQGGYAVLPDDIILSAARMTAFMYHKREAPFEVTAFPDVGQIVVPSATPSDIVQALSPYERVRP